MKQAALIPKDYIDPPWDKKRLGDLETAIPVLKKLTATEKTIFNAESVGFCVAMHWLYKKKYNRQHSLVKMFSPSLRKTFEPFGDLLYATFELTKELHSMGNELGGCYRYAVDWFVPCVFELRAWLMFSPESNSKKEKIVNLRSDIKNIRNGINPFNPNLMPHTWRLFEAIARVSKNPNRKKMIERDYLYSEKGRWVGFVTALSSFAKRIDEIPEIQIAVVNYENNMLKVRNGKNKGFKVLSQKTT